MDNGPNPGNQNAKFFGVFAALILGLLTLTNAVAQTPLTASGGASVSDTDISGICAFCSWADTDNIVDADLNNEATLNLAIGLGVSGSVCVDMGQTYEAGSVVGFVADLNGGVAGLLSNSRIATFLDGNVQESTNTGASLINLLGIGGGASLAMLTSEPADELCVVYDSLAGVLAEYRTYYAFASTDADGDGVSDGDEDVDGDGNPENDDTDNDTIPDYLDPDDDGDGVNTLAEDRDGDGDPTNDDSDTDGTPDYLDPDPVDSDGDGVNDRDEDRDGDGMLDDDDTDNDTIPDYLDTDDDGDGIDTIDEDRNGDGDPTNDDSDHDGLPDYLDPDPVESFIFADSFEDIETM